MDEARRSGRGGPRHGLSRWLARTVGAALFATGLGAAGAAHRPASHLARPPTVAPSSTPEIAADSASSPAPAPSSPPKPASMAATKAPPKPASPLAHCAGADAVPPLQKTWATCANDRSHETVTLVFVTDMHAHVHRYLPGKRSPLSVLRAYVARRRIETGGRVLFLDGGDDLEKGALLDAWSGGAATVHLLDHLGLDARTLGNHDFAYGVASVLAQTKTTAFPVLASNVDGPAGFGARRTVMLDVGCAKIGLFGLLLPPYDERDEIHDVPYLGAFTTHHDDDGRYPRLAEALAKELRVAGADAVVGLDHLGMVRDRPILDEAPSVDLVLSGHDHFHLGGQPLRGKFGVLVDGGSFLPGQGDANGEAHVDEITLDVDLEKHTARLVGTKTLRLADVADLDLDLEAEVERMQACFAKGTDEPIADLAFPLRAGAPAAWAPIVSAAIQRRFPKADAWLFERASFGGIAKEDLSEGPVTAQGLAHFAYVEKQAPGGPGFTALVPVPIEGRALLALCAAKTHAAWNLRVERHCPASIEEDRTYLLVIQRRLLHAPARAFPAVPSGFPDAAHVDHDAVEVRDLLIEHAKARGAACLFLDRDQEAPCRPPK